MRCSNFTLACLGLVSSLATALDAPSCGPKQRCPESAPCCSAYGSCGTGAYCLGGCDPLSSHSIDSCMARPTCKSEDYSLDSLSGMIANTEYLGDASDVNWVVQGYPVTYHNDSVLLTMAQNTEGTLLASTKYIWYGKISATLRTSGGQGVVTAFIMMSDVKDEIDFEFVGADLQAVQSNFYWHGVKNYTNSRNLTAANTNTEWHTYEIDWQENALTWSVDGQVLRTLKKDDTYNSATGQYRYPQTPSRIQLSLWPAGTSQNAAGTIEWAGGLINWNSPYMANGYYYAQIKEISVQCADPPSGTKIQGTESYQYTNYAGLQSSVDITNDNTVLGSFYASGEDPNYNPKSKTSGSSKPKPSNVQVVPGISGGGVRTDGGGSSSGNGLPGSGASRTKFSQGIHNGAASGLHAKAITSSAFAAVVAFTVLIAL